MICRLFAQQQKKQQLGAELIALLGTGEYHQLTVVVAFLRSEGVHQLKESLEKFVKSGKHARFIVGISRRVTSYEGLALLLKTAGEGSVTIFHNASTSAGIFHPKLYLLEGEKKAAAVIASNNLTESGLFLNYELAIIIELDPQKSEDRQLQQELSEYINELTASGEIAKTLTPEFLEKLKEAGALELEAQETDTEPEEEEKAEAKLESATRQNKIKGLFGMAPVTSAPTRGKKPSPGGAKPKEKEPVATMPGRPLETSLIMRPFPSRNGTQIQIPVMANERFFADTSDIISEHNGDKHRIHKARARGKTNTLKLEIPECWDLKVPVLMFYKTAGGTTYRVFDGRSGEGKELLKRLEQGLADGSTVRTYARSTMWRLE